MLYAQSSFSSLICLLNKCSVYLLCAVHCGRLWDIRISSMYEMSHRSYMGTGASNGHSELGTELSTLEGSDTVVCKDTAKNGLGLKMKEVWGSDINLLKLRWKESIPCEGRVCAKALGGKALCF